MKTLTINPPSEKQKLFLKAATKHIAFGGARGGGKSWSVRTKAKLLALRYAGIRILIVRRTYPELINNHINILRVELLEIAKYNDKYDEEKEPLNQFGAAAYDCVYAIVGALEAAIAAGEEVDAKTSATEMCEILKAQFNGGYTLENAVTGESISWESNGYVNKIAIQYFMK